MASALCLRSGPLSGLAARKPAATTACWLGSTSTTRRIVTCNDAVSGAWGGTARPTDHSARRSPRSSLFHQTRQAPRTTPMCQVALRGPWRFIDLGDVPEPERSRKIRTALLVETINVAVWMLAAFLIYQVAARTGTHWLLLPPLREACKGTSNVISYVIELWI